MNQSELCLKTFDFDKLLNLTFPICVTHDRHSNSATRTVTGASGLPEPSDDINYKIGQSVLQIKHGYLRGNRRNCEVT